jgi:hypothetical protein
VSVQRFLSLNVSLSLGLCLFRDAGRGPRGAGFHRPCGTRTSVFDLEDRSYGGGCGGDGVGKKLAWGGFLAELVSLIRDDLLGTDVQKFEGRHVMAGGLVYDYVSTKLQARCARLVEACTAVA